MPGATRRDEATSQMPHMQRDVAVQVKVDIPHLDIDGLPARFHAGAGRESRGKQRDHNRAHEGLTCRNEATSVVELVCS